MATAKQKKLLEMRDELLLEIGAKKAEKEKIDSEIAELEERAADIVTEMFKSPEPRKKRGQAEEKESSGEESKNEEPADQKQEASDDSAEQAELDEQNKGYPENLDLSEDPKPISAAPLF